MATVFVWHEAAPASMVIPTRGLYQPGVHFENADTKRRFKNMLDGYDLTPMLQPLTPDMADDEMLLRFHTREYLDKVKTLSDAMGGEAGDFAPVAPGSNEIARLGVGGTVDAFEGVSSGLVDKAYALVRPCGQHAERDRGMGFCTFNNIAVAIKNAVAKQQVERVVVGDWDVHHGNGTKQAFYENADMLTISLHQDKLYPVYSGAFESRGSAAGEGFNLNLPLLPGSGAELSSTRWKKLICHRYIHTGRT
jgi:acetoin utilization deacetylase AcuC-like enzyme